ncbi:hypothetical protein CCHR01_09009 [Colletotrichum chrysophilum]|uniref:Uncharacterized protein n=1 Tax=Colletotrichum chrysophilum TaxID=1836956 RepID=A0AAD9AHP0_9PEZI|nr:hypothetical protein CCHR01_09009 [Colletotrichum chrysophilum]
MTRGPPPSHPPPKGLHFHSKLSSSNFEELQDLGCPLNPERCGCAALLKDWWAVATETEGEEEEAQGFWEGHSESVRWTHILLERPLQKQPRSS